MQFITLLRPSEGGAAAFRRLFALFLTTAIFHPRRCALGKTCEPTVSFHRLSLDISLVVLDSLCHCRNRLIGFITFVIITNIFLIENSNNIFLNNNAKTLK